MTQVTTTYRIHGHGRLILPKTLDIRARMGHGLDILPQGLEGETIPVEMIANHEMGWETGAREIRLVPTSLGVLGLYQILHPGPDLGREGFARGDEAH